MRSLCAVKSCIYGLSRRDVCCSAPLQGKKNFRKFMLHNRGTKLFKEQQRIKPDPDVPVYTYGVRKTGYKVGNTFVTVPEMIPELVVPDLKGFKLKPYVSYRAPDVLQTEFDSQDLFDAVYSKKIVEDFKNNKLNPDGTPIKPAPEESLQPEDAINRARKTGSDIF